MATIEKYARNQVNQGNILFSKLRTTVETAFYGTNMHEVPSLSAAYALACASPGVIITDLPVLHTEELGLPHDAKILVENGGKVVGRTARARRNRGENKEEDSKLEEIVREVIYQNRLRKYYKANAFVGLDKDFMVKAHIAFPEGNENNLYSWLLNFQWADRAYKELYQQSRPYEEGDIYIYADPDWRHPDYPNGLAYFEPDRNVACILGMQYFGEFKKATLTLAWGTGHRNGYVACHGGLKEFLLPENRSYVAAFFGMSGSGKSTLTHAKHGHKYEVEVLHDDAFLIDLTDGSSIALEPAYFDKTQDYPADHPEQDYFVTVQNVGVTRDLDDKLVLVTEDIRNGNGRTVKSRYSTPNRVDKIKEPINAVYWIMKDDSLPPLVKIDSAVLGASFGLTLATKRTSAENVKQNESVDKLIIEPYANPFRVYPLIEDYNDFKTLLENEVDCYILNTGSFMGKKITKEVTLQAVERNVEQTAVFTPFAGLKELQYMEIEGFNPVFEDPQYLSLVRERLEMRMAYVRDFNEKNPHQALPEEITASLQQITSHLASGSNQI